MGHKGYPMMYTQNTVPCIPKFWQSAYLNAKGQALKNAVDAWGKQQQAW